MKTLSYLVKTMFALFLLLFFSCNRGEINSDIEKQILDANKLENIENDFLDPEINFRLGEKLENPFSVTNMKKALKSLHSKNLLLSKSLKSIKTTHLYVRFLPRNDYDVVKLQRDDKLTLFDFPLDQELEEGVGGSYHDRSIPFRQITWQYTVVPIDYRFRNIRYEILEHLHLDDEETNKNKSDFKITDWISLENEAFSITNNKEYINNSNLNVSAKKWYPKGRITYEDNTSGKRVGIEGAKIIVKRWFRWRSDITDENGNFKVGFFRSSKVKCAIKWERADWDIRSGNYGQAWYSFSSLKEGNDWNLYIDETNKELSWLYASVHRGAQHYFDYYKVYDIRKPYDKAFLEPRLHIGAKNKSGVAHYFTFNSIIWSAPVIIYKNDHDSRELFGTTAHEIAHVSHWEIGYSTAQYVIDALADDPFLPESWATGVEYAMVERKYPKSFNGIYDFDYQQNRSLSSIKNNGGYTPIVFDMIDSYNQSNGNSNRPNDRVKNYTLGQLEDALPGALGSWWSWRSRIREMYNNPTEGEELNYLFQEYR